MPEELLSAVERPDARTSLEFILFLCWVAYLKRCHNAYACFYVVQVCV